MDYRGLVYFMGLNTASGDEFDRKVKQLQASHNKLKKHKDQRDSVTNKGRLASLMASD